MAITETLETLLHKVKDLARSSTVVGDPIQVGNSTVIPISKVSVGFGTGAYGSDGQSGRKRDSEGASGGFNVTPVAIVLIQGDDSRLMLLDKEDRTISKIMDLLPDVLDRFVPKHDDKE